MCVLHCLFFSFHMSIFYNLFHFAVDSPPKDLKDCLDFSGWKISILYWFTELRLRTERQRGSTMQRQKCILRLNRVSMYKWIQLCFVNVWGIALCKFSSCFVWCGRIFEYFHRRSNVKVPPQRLKYFNRLFLDHSCCVRLWLRFYIIINIWFDGRAIYNIIHFDGDYTP